MAKETGRPSKFSKQIADIIIRLAKEGKDDSQIAKTIGIATSTLRLWKGKHPEFSAALKESKDVADELVEISLYRKATGYYHKATKLFCYEGKVIKEDYIERFPPDTTAAIFWLKNRQPDKWREKKEEENEKPMTVEVVRPNGERIIYGGGEK